MESKPISLVRWVALLACLINLHGENDLLPQQSVLLLQPQQTRIVVVTMSLYGDNCNCCVAYINQSGHGLSMIFGLKNESGN